MKNSILSIPLKILLIYIFVLTGTARSQWVQINLNLNSNEIVYDAIEANGKFIIANSTGVYYTTNSGMNWISTNLNNVEVFKLFYLENKIYASNYSGLYRSEVENIQFNYLNMNRNSYSLCIFDGKIFAGTAFGLKYTTNDGINWTNLSEHVFSDLVVKNGNIWGLRDIIHLPYPVYYSDNFGSNWQNLKIYGLILRSLDNDLFLAAKDSLYFSSNSGMNWRGIPFQNYYNFRTISLDTKTNLITLTKRNSVYISTNRGENWMQKNEGLDSAQRNLDKYLKIGDSYLTMILTGNNNLIFKYLFKRLISEAVGIESISSVIPEKYSLSQNYPNPFNPVTRIRFNIPSVGNNSKSEVLLDVYDVSGKLVKQLYKGQLSGGEYEFEFDGTGFNSGVYFYRLQSENFSETRKMVLVK